MNLVYKHENKAILYSVRNLLELNGIACFLKNEHSASGAGNLGMSLIEAELWIVNSDDLDQANSLIGEMNSDSSTGPGWICKNCDEENEGSFEICWKCQSEPDDA
jgi:hypothetical protein